MVLYSHTPSAGGIIINNDKVLVITSKLRNSTDFPKGTLEEGESIDAAAIREVEEETGYRTRITQDLGSITYDILKPDGANYRKTVSYFLLELADNDEPIKNLQDSEDFENEWLPFDEAYDRLTYPDTKELLQKAQKLHG